MKKYNLNDICEQLKYHQFDTKESLNKILPVDLVCNDYHELYKLFYNSPKSFIRGKKEFLRYALINNIKNLSSHFEIMYYDIDEWNNMDWEERGIATKLYVNNSFNTIEEINKLNYSDNVKAWLKYRIK